MGQKKYNLSVEQVGQKLTNMLTTYKRVKGMTGYRRGWSLTQYSSFQKLATEFAHSLSFMHNAEEGSLHGSVHNGNKSSAIFRREVEQFSHGLLRTLL